MYVTSLALQTASSPAYLHCILLLHGLLGIINNQVCFVFQPVLKTYRDNKNNKNTQQGMKQILDFSRDVIDS